MPHTVDPLCCHSCHNCPICLNCPNCLPSLADPAPVTPGTPVGPVGPIADPAPVVVGLADPIPDSGGVIPFVPSPPVGPPTPEPPVTLPLPVKDEDALTITFNNVSNYDAAFTVRANGLHSKYAYVGFSLDDLIESNRDVLIAMKKIINNTATNRQNNFKKTVALDAVTDDAIFNMVISLRERMDKYVKNAPELQAIVELESQMLKQLVSLQVEPLSDLSKQMNRVMFTSFATPSDEDVHMFTDAMISMNGVPVIFDNLVKNKPFLFVTFGFDSLFQIISAHQIAYKIVDSFKAAAAGNPIPLLTAMEDILQGMSIDFWMLTPRADNVYNNEERTPHPAAPYVEATVDVKKPIIQRVVHRPAVKKSTRMNMNLI